MNCGTWKLGREIGKGAYGTVYLARNAEGGWAAVKVCRKPEGASDEAYKREQRGIRLYATLPSTRGLVRLLGTGDCEGGFYSAFELADDEFNGRNFNAANYRPRSLASVIAGEKALPLEQCLELGTTLAEGLETLQRHHLLHRDIKPGNIIFVDGKPVLSDPGLLVEEAAAVSAVGTPGYVPPESFVAAGSDIYSLGLTLKAVSFGRPVEELAKGPALESDAASPLFVRWWQILNKATEKDESRRYQSAKAFAKDLQALRVRTSLMNFVGSRAGRWALAGVVVVAVLAAVVSYRQMKRDVAPALNMAKELEHAQVEAVRNGRWVALGIPVSMYGAQISAAQMDVDAAGRLNDPVVQETAQKLAAELKSLEAESKQLDERFRALQSAAQEARNAGKNDASEWGQAQLVAKRVNEIKARLDEISAACKKMEKTKK